MNNKNRFMVDTAGTLIDLDTLDTFDIVEEVVDLMNDLNNKNKLLKSINQGHCDYIGDLEADFERLKKEYESRKLKV